MRYKVVFVRKDMFSIGYLPHGSHEMLWFNPMQAPAACITKHESCCPPGGWDETFI